MDLGLVLAANRPPQSQGKPALPPQASATATEASGRSFADTLAAVAGGIDGAPIDEDAPSDAGDDVTALLAAGVLPVADPASTGMPVELSVPLTVVTSTDEGTVDDTDVAADTGHTDEPSAVPAEAGAETRSTARTSIGGRRSNHEPGARPVPHVPVAANPPAAPPSPSGAAEPFAQASAMERGRVPVQRPMSPDVSKAEVAFIDGATSQPAPIDTDAPLAALAEAAVAPAATPRNAEVPGDMTQARGETTAEPRTAVVGAPVTPANETKESSDADVSDLSGDGQERNKDLPAPAVRVPIDQAVASAVADRPTAAGDAGPQLVALAHGPTLMPYAATVIHTSRQVTASALASAFASAQASGLPGETSSQIVQSLRLQLMQGGGTAHIRLEPQYFGELNVSIRVDQGQVVARLEAEAPVVREWLQTNQAWLRSNLAEHNLTLDRIEVSEPGESRNGERRHGDSSASPREDRPRQRRRRPETGELFEVVA